MNCKNGHEPITRVALLGSHKHKEHLSSSVLGLSTLVPHRYQLPPYLSSSRETQASQPHFSATDRAPVCFPLLQAAAALTLDSLFNHVTGTVCGSFVSSNEIQRLVHTLEYQRSTRQLLGLGTIARLHHWVQSLISCDSAARNHTSEALELCSTRLHLFFWRPTAIRQHEIWTRPAT